MPQLPTEALIAIVGIILAAVLCIFYAVANAVRLETQLYDTKVKIRRLKEVYAAQAAAIQEKQSLIDQVSIVGQGPVSKAA